METVLVNNWVVPKFDVELINHLKNDAYQAPTRSKLIANCKSFRTVIHVGAHIGTWARDLADKFKNVICFEPEQLNFYCLQQNIKDRKNVCLFNYALGDEERFLNLKNEKNNSSMSWFLMGEGKIPVKKLDSFQFKNVDAIIIDVEGFGKNVISGGLQTIKKWKPTICIEQKLAKHHYGQSKFGASNLLKKIGMKVADVDRHDFIMVWE